MDEAYMIPTSVKEVENLGWDYIDVILFSGDAFIDHPSFGTAFRSRTGVTISAISGNSAGRVFISE